MAIRVLHIHRSILFGGAENSILQLSRGQRQMGMQPAVLTSPDCRFYEAVQAAGIEVFSSPLDAPRWRFLRSAVRYWRELARVVRAARPDVLHIGLFPFLNDTYLLNVLCSVPTVVHVRGPLGRHQLNFRTSFGIRRAAGIICISDFVKRTVLNVLPKAKVSVIYNALEPSSFVPERDQAAVRAEMGFDDDVFLVGMFANFIERWKKHDTLIRAAARLKGRSRIGFALVGGTGPDPSYHDDVLKLAKELGVEGTVRFVGFAKDVASYVNAMDVVVCCSEGEGFGRVFLEGMACAKPMIAANSGACPELVRHGKNGFLYELDDDEELMRHILDLSLHPELARRMGAAGRDYLMDSFGLQRHTEAVARVYDDSLKKQT